MIDWSELAELHEASKSGNEEIKNAAESAIDANFDSWLTEYLGLPENRHETTATVGLSKFVAGEPRWTSLADLGAWVVGWLRQNDGESTKEFLARVDRLKNADKLETLLRHRKYEAARAVRKSDTDFVRIGEDTFHLSVWWSVRDPNQPVTENEIILA